jgi:hypothetical protein
MVKEITLTIPTDWSGVTLKKYLTLQKDMKNYGDDEEAQTALMLSHLCGLNAEYINSLSIEDYNTVRLTLEGFINNTEYPLQKIININGKEYGFEPNLSQMSYGAYVDISKFGQLTIDDNWPKIMSILYRPIVNKKGDMYTIEGYKGDIDDKLFLGVTMDVQFGALFFFVNLLTDLLSATLKYLKVTGLPPNIKSILEKSGEITKRLLNLQTESTAASIGQQNNP